MLPRSLTNMQHVAPAQEQKKKVLDEVETHKRGGSFMQSDVIQQAENEFKTQACTLQSTISCILKRGKEGILELENVAINKKSDGKHHALKNNPSDCVNEQSTMSRCISGAMIQEVGYQIQQQVNQKLPEELQKNLKLSNGWLHRLQNR